MIESKIRLTDGREIWQVSSFTRNLAVDLLAGIAEAILEEHAISTAKRIWPGEHYSLIKCSKPDQCSLISSQYLCMGEFVSHRLPRSEDIASSLVVIWFQTDLNKDWEASAMHELRVIDWDRKARSFSW